MYLAQGIKHPQVYNDNADTVCTIVNTTATYVTLNNLPDVGSQLVVEVDAPQELLGSPVAVMDSHLVLFPRVDNSCLPNLFAKT